ncbi:hypothetical protein L6E12_31390 [Actinokineospora sp. PR83]|uniref:hypothetical protein n=1 Tax=Actinokineospora sp. PR83 TaxID=2884908 RepID=UPI001F2FF20E|nr:hypothetical protein [Actinokineospora sp. PR83]MCG8920283.1 hypothetical protein [Actinokineospora sp. PR83]
MLWTWMLGAYLLVLTAIVGCAGYVALFVSNRDRAERASRILKTTMVAVTGGGGTVAVIVRLHETGLL